MALKDDMKFIYEYGNDMSWIENEKINPSDEIFYNDFTDKKWVKEFYDYIKLVFSKLISNMKGYSIEEKKEILSLIVNKDTIKYFIYAVTHESVEINPEKNYQTYETIGDVYMGATFVAYLRERFPSIIPNSLTDIKHAILSTEHQGKASEKMGLPNWAIIYQPDKGKNNKIKLEADMKLKEDMLESFFGALSFILSLNGKSRYLIDILSSYNHLCFDKRYFVFDRYVTKDTKSVVGQFFQQTVGTLKEGGFKMKETVENEDTPERIITITLYITEEKNQELKKKVGIYFKNPVFGKGKAFLKSDAEKNAYENAKSNMLKINENIFEIPREKKKGKIENTEEIIKTANKRLKRKDIIDINILPVYHTGKYTVFQILGDLENGKKIIIYTKTFESTGVMKLPQKIAIIADEYLNNHEG